MWWETVESICSMTIDWLEVVWCAFGETHELSYKTVATFNLNNTVYYEDLSLSGTLRKTPPIFASQYYLALEFQTNAQGYQRSNGTVLTLRHLKFTIWHRSQSSMRLILSFSRKENWGSESRHSLPWVPQRETTHHNHNWLKQQNHHSHHHLNQRSLRAYYVPDNTRGPLMDRIFAIT